MPNVFIGIPHYGSVNAGMIRTMLDATRDPEVKLIVMPAGGSLLCRNFNSLWCRALNERLNGPVDYFVMIHSDIEAESGWLDKLLDQRARARADVLSVVVPIKDRRGLTTTGLSEKKSTNVRRFTCREIHQFTEIFSAPDTGHPDKYLMVNTGLWIADFSKPWVDEVCFQIEDWTRKLDDGTVSAECFSEDWNFSHWLGRRDLRVFATRGIKVLHHGEVVFSASDPDFGLWDTDLGNEPLPDPAGVAL